MIGPVSFLDRIAPGFYILLAVAFMWNLWKARRTSTQYRATYFELERELTRVRRLNALTALVVVALVGLILLGVQRSILPFLRQVQGVQELQEQVAQVVDGSFLTTTPRAPDPSSLNFVPVEDLGASESVGIIATPTLTPEPVGTIIPNAPVIQGCTDPRAQLTLPVNGMRVFQPIAIEGVAYTDNLSSWKIEMNGPGTFGTWVVLDGKNQPVTTTGPLTQFTPSGFGTANPGLYQMRLMVFDITGMPVASCMVNVYITEPPATLTPSPTPST